MASTTPKQHIIDRLKDVDNVLITVNANPTVDELAAALGITLVLDKLEKHATAVFSGTIPAAIDFLKPKDTFEGTVDSLRDFIIALDKEKADHLRYKVDGDMVKIFITPYKTTITDQDLEFSQGDYNVEMVLAIGVKEASDLDKSLEDHGKIMHDATVATISITERESDLGSIHWYNGEASSYSEVLTILAQDLRTDKSLIDEQIANAFLTGIVAATDRFSNQHTTAEVMTVAAQLMAAGANQQLIVTKLEEANEAEEPISKKDDMLENDTKAKIKREPKEEEQPEEPVVDKQAADGSMAISHTKRGDVDEVAERKASENQEAATRKAEQELAESISEKESQEMTTVVEEVPTEELSNSVLESSVDEEDAIGPVPNAPEVSLPPPVIDEPTLGGTLNATSEQAAEDKRRELEADRNKVIMSHGQPMQFVGNPPASALASPFTAAQQPDTGEPPSVDPFVEPLVGAQGDESLSKAPDLQPISPPAEIVPEPVNSGVLPQFPELPPLGGIAPPSNVPQVDEAQAAVEAALQAPLPATSMPAVPDFGGLPPLPSMPADFSQLPPLPGMPAMPDIPGMPGFPVGTEPAPAPMADGVAPEPRLEDIMAPPLGLNPSAPVTAPADPSQFQIPGQQ
ncbi:MAG TPA: hypothetical protein PKD19_03010 [Candidatus Saccharibacteria bacterium]|nr:hypothetical protein [Candidatus Saccharibacteria bacterium]HMR37990.1 hypothetical protein [Candidatus Saccharibacteria bacterium]